MRIESTYRPATIGRGARRSACRLQGAFHDNSSHRPGTGIPGGFRGEGPDHLLSWYTIDGGGATWTASGNFELSGTIGQPDAGALMTGGAFELIGGFWPIPAPPPVITGDLNCDGTYGQGSFGDINHFVLILSNLAAWSCGTLWLRTPQSALCGLFGIESSRDVVDWKYCCTAAECDGVSPARSPGYTQATALWLELGTISRFCCDRVLA